jgi:ATP-dependent Clp protease ATP-binding subunit ClpA
MKLKRLKNRLKDNDIILSFDNDYINATIKSILHEKIKVEALSKKIVSEITPFVSDSILKGEKNIKLFIDKSKTKSDDKA